jgi:hypothetical protein
MLAGARQITGTVLIDGIDVDLPSYYPNYAIGFGLPVIDRALYMAGYAGPYANGLQLTTPTLPAFAAGAAAPHLYQFKCGAFADKAVHVVLTWTDPAGNPVASNQIVNDLDLIVVPYGASEVFGNIGDFPDSSNTVEKVALADCGFSGRLIRVAVSPARVVFAQRYALVVNGNVMMDSFSSISSGTFSFDPKRITPLAHSASPLNESSCLIIVELPLIPERLPLSSSSSDFSLTFAASRFSAALAMHLGVSLDAVTAAFVDNSTMHLSIQCSSYVCGSSTSVCYVSARDIADALSTHSQRLALLPASNPISVVRWTSIAVNVTGPPSPSTSKSSHSLLQYHPVMPCFLFVFVFCFV